MKGCYNCKHGQGIAYPLSDFHCWLCNITWLLRFDLGWVKAKFIGWPATGPAVPRPRSQSTDEDDFDELENEERGE